MNPKKLLSLLAILAIGFFVGISTLSVTAQTSGSCVSPSGTWTEPSAAPTGGNACPPLNTGSSLQEKLGSLQIDGDLGLLGTFVYKPVGSTPKAGQFLMAASTTGQVAWSDINISCPSGQVLQGFSGGGATCVDMSAPTVHGAISWLGPVSGLWYTIPAGPSTVTIEVWGGGGGGGLNHGAGGGGGGYAKYENYPVPSNRKFLVYAGDNGKGGFYDYSPCGYGGYAKDGTAGGTSWVQDGSDQRQIIYGNGGLGGHSNSTTCGSGNPLGAIGGTGGSLYYDAGVSTQVGNPAVGSGIIKQSGSQGTGGTDSTGGETSKNNGGGNAGGPGGGTGAPTAAAGSNCLAGNPGGGGCGEANGGAGFAGGSGGVGKVTITW